MEPPQDLPVSGARGDRLGERLDRTTEAGRWRRAATASRSTAAPEEGRRRRDRQQPARVALGTGTLNVARDEPKNIIVTGGCGFIGSNFVHYVVNNHPGCTSPSWTSDLRRQPREHRRGCPSDRVELRRGRHP